MTASETQIDYTGSGFPRWGLCFALVVVLHGAFALLVQSWRVPLMDHGLPPAVMIDLAPLAKPLDRIQPIAPAEPRPEPAPEPEPLPEPPPLVKPAVVLPPRPKPRPVPQNIEKPQPAPEQSRDEPAIAAVAPPAPPAPPALLQQSNAIPSWRGLLLGHLNRHKRYPREAQARRLQGIVQLRFTMDRAGHVLAARIERGSGFAVLDEETLALIRRAEPLPPPPPELTGETLDLIVPL